LQVYSFRCEWVRLTGLAPRCSAISPAQYTGAQAGQMAYYWLRWVNTRGEKGPWSEPVSATIAG
jgi:predicted phage tail protein